MEFGGRQVAAPTSAIDGNCRAGPWSRRVPLSLEIVGATHTTPRRGEKKRLRIGCVAEKTVTAEGALLSCRRTRK